MANVESIVQDLQSLSEQEQARIIQIYRQRLQLPEFDISGKPIQYSMQLEQGLYELRASHTIHEKEQKDTNVKAMREFLKSGGLLERKPSAASKQLDMINQQLANGQGDVEELVALATDVANQQIKNTA